MRTRLIGAIALFAIPLCTYLVGSVEARRPAPLRSIDSESANVRVEIVVEGTPAVVYRDGSYRWIEGRRGERFSYRVTNWNGFPVGVILSADGQSLTADGPASASHPAYVIGPHESETVSIWREDLRGGRELIFTDVDRSLAARKGDRRNIGVLGVLVWRLEDKTPPRPVPITPRDKQQGGRPSAEDADAAAPNRSSGIGVGTGDRVDDSAYLTDRYRRVRVLTTLSVYYDDRTGLERAGVDLGQYRDLDTPDRRRADPFPEYQGVRIP